MKFHRYIAPSVFALATIALFPGLQARADGVRLMLKSEGAANIEVISSSSDAKFVTQDPKKITLDQTINPGQWTTVTIKFKVTEDGDFPLRISAQWTKADDKWVFIDNVKGEGITIQNPDFETGGVDAPAGWKFRKGESGPASYVTDAAMAASGQHFVKVSHNSPVIQVIHVTKGTEVTLSFSARPATK